MRPLLQRWKVPHRLHPGLQEVQLAVREKGDIRAQHPRRGLADGEGGKEQEHMPFISLG